MHLSVRVVTVVIRAGEKRGKTTAHYSIAIPRPSNHMIDVSMRVAGRDAPFVWPCRLDSGFVHGSGQRFADAGASVPDGTPIPWVQEDKRTWVIDSSGLETIEFATGCMPTN